MKKTIIIRDEQLRKRALTIIDRIPLDAVHEVIVKPHRTSRSSQQNSLYWMWNALIGDELGYTKDEMHDLNRKQFGLSIAAEKDDWIKSEWERIDLIADKLQRHNELMAFVVHVVHTPSFDIEEMRYYLNDIDQFAISMGIPLPVPQNLHLMRKDHRNES